MGFFERLPDPKPRPEQEQVRLPIEPRPSWNGPPHHEIGGDVAFRPFLVRTELMALRIDRLILFSTGLQIDLDLRFSDYPHEELEFYGGFPWAMIKPWNERRRHEAPWDMPIQPENQFRFGVRLANGGSAATGTMKEWVDGTEDPPDQGKSPTAPRLSHGPGSGGSGMLHSVGSVWLWPAPPAGPVDIVFKWPALGIEETTRRIPADLLEDAAKRIEEVWPASDI